MSLSLVRTVVEMHIEQQRKINDAAYIARHKDSLVPHLFISDVGVCPRKAVWSALVHYPHHQLHADVTHPFSPYVQAIMRCGNVWETETEAALRAAYGDALQTQVPVRNEYWSGRVDFVLFGPNDTVIIEHKATNPYNFRSKDRLPYRHHCLQVLAYQKILNLPVSSAQLYYRGWNNWAEFAVRDEGNTIEWEGLINGAYKTGMIEANLTDIMDYIEDYWSTGFMPPAYSSPTSLDFACTRKTRQGRYPSCQFFGCCWHGLPQVGPLPKLTIKEKA